MSNRPFSFVNCNVIIQVYILPYIYESGCYAGNYSVVVTLKNIIYYLICTGNIACSTQHLLQNVGGLSYGLLETF